VGHPIHAAESSNISFDQGGINKAVSLGEYHVLLVLTLTISGTADRSSGFHLGISSEGGGGSSQIAWL
jgi:hypothetical protein